MDLYEKIKQIYPELESINFDPISGSILLRDDGDGCGVYIAKWEHPTLQRPTDEQLAEIN